ncbi:NBAD hydrolase [Operophtera brumata]|uniref:NBAD hydrolase n=1 Tax=Operophtera brumata TaxID=104452 RepID=A0A0L7KVL4_OPEBR|nr:NBAD hydrolase [Operophtera brumata]
MQFSCTILEGYIIGEGRNFASVIKSFVSSFGNLRDFEAEYKTDAGRAIYDKTLANMKRKFPYYVKEIQGVADGAKVPFYQLFLLQLDDIMLTANHNHVPRNDTGGCSSIGVNNRQYNGLVFSINTLSPHQLKPGNTPRTFITRKILAAKSFPDAEKILRDEGLGIANGFSLNMIWSDAWGSSKMYNVEVAPDLKADRSQLHRLPVVNVIGKIIDSSEWRLATIRSHPPPQSRRDVADILSDTSGEEFRVFQDQQDAIIKTIAAGIFDVEKRTWSLYINKPNVSEPIAVLPIQFHALENLY